MKPLHWMGALGALLVTVACGSNPVPTATVADAKSSVSAAEAVGAQNLPAAALHLKMARDQLARADAQMRDGDDDEARLTLERAKIDAEMALMLTRENALRAEATQAEQKVEEIGR